MKNTQRVVILRGGVGARERERGHAIGLSHPWRIQEEMDDGVMMMCLMMKRWIEGEGER